MNSMDQMNRRRFLGGLACAAIAPTLGQATPKPWTMRTAASSVAFTRLPIEEACSRIAQLGFEAIDIWGNFRGCTHLDDAAKRLGAEGLSELLAKNKLKLCAFSIYTLGYKDPYAEMLGKMGGGVAVRGSQGGEPKNAKELITRMKAFFESLKPSIELAEKNDSYIAIENHANALLHTLDSLKAFADLNPSKRLGVALAPPHLQIGKISITEAIRVVDKHLLFFYAWQNSDAGNQQGISQLPGHGPVDFTPILRALADIDYKRHVTPFLHHEPEPDIVAPALKKSQEYLAECYRKAMKA